jgi:hypothetical protein
LALLFIHVDCFIVNKVQDGQLSATHLDASPRGKTNNPGMTNLRGNRNQLHRVIQSIEYYGQDEGGDQRASKELLEAMSMLSQAKSQRDVMVVGKLLDKLDIVNEECRPIQERLLKATSLSGLFSTSLMIVRSMLDSSYLPSRMAYTSVCSSLRQAGRKEQLEQLMYDLSEVAHQCDSSIDVVAWNIFLATLCNSVEYPADPTLAKMWKWMDPSTAKEQFCVQPDIASYNTLLFAAARVGNQTLVDTIWEDMQKQIDFQPDVRAYNSRLKVSSNGAERLQIFEEIQRILTIAPDRYTINLMIHDLIKADRVTELEVLINDFVACNSENVKSDAFSAFLVTLVQKGDVISARALFDTYIDKESSYFSVLPDTRHFNILIDGYRNLAEAKLESHLRDTDLESPSDSRRMKLASDEHDTKKAAALAGGRNLYRKMVQLGIYRDSYTLSSMMGLCVSSEELVKLMEDSNASLTPVVLRSAMTQCGHLGDPSQACALFDQYAIESMNVRVWNVLLGALAEGAKQNDIVLDVKSANVCKRGSTRSGTGISALIDGLKCSEAIRIILNTMSNSSKERKAPFPNSQSYCITASALQYGPSSVGLGLGLFRNSTYAGIPADGRFINAVFRCFGDDISAALESWKGEIRSACLEHESRTRRAPVSIYRSRNKNLIAAYNGLLYVCGRALRPDIAVRLASAMNREGIEPDEVSLNSYSAGKRIRGEIQSGQASDEKENEGGYKWPRLLPKLNMVEQYESLLYVECTKYNPNSKLTSGDTLVRIIL